MSVFDWVGRLWAKNEAAAEQSEPAPVESPFEEPVPPEAGLEERALAALEDKREELERRRCKHRQHAACQIYWHLYNSKGDTDTIESRLERVGSALIGPDRVPAEVFRYYVCDLPIILKPYRFPVEHFGWDQVEYKMIYRFTATESVEIHNLGDLGAVIERVRKEGAAPAGVELLGIGEALTAVCMAAWVSGNILELIPETVAKRPSHRM